MNLAFFASHTGSNMQAVIDACKSGDLNAKPCVVISNNSNSEVLTRARREEIPAFHLSSQTHPDPVQLERAILSILKQELTEFVILAGYTKRKQDTGGL